MPRFERLPSGLGLEYMEDEGVPTDIGRSIYKKIIQTFGGYEFFVVKDANSTLPINSKLPIQIMGYVFLN